MPLTPRGYHLFSDDSLKKAGAEVYEGNSMILWKDLSRFPVTDLIWGVVKDNKVLVTEEGQTKQLAKKWTYFSPQLFTSPSTNRLLPAGLVPELEPSCRKKVVMSHMAIFFVGIYVVGLSFFAFSGLLGPFFHGNFLHWLSNFCWVIFFLPLLGWIDFKLSVLLLYLSAVLSHVVTYLAVKYGLSPPADGITGVSGMVFFAMGFVFVNSLRYREFYPEGFHLSIGLLTLLNLLLPYLFGLNSNASLEAHLTGIGLGALMGFLLNPLDAIKAN